MLTTNEVPIELPAGQLGIITDIHGNTAALGAVLADGKQQGVSQWLVLGDVVAMGPSPVGVLELLDELDLVGCISGNTERYVLTGDRPAPTFDEVLAEPGRGLPRLVEVVGSFSWTKGFLTAAGRLETLRAFQPTLRFVLADGTRLLAVHASQVSDADQGIHPDVGQPQMEALFPAPAADVVVGGHTHERTDVQYGSVRYVNPGSVSNHNADAVATYSVLHSAADHHHFDHRDVVYDVQRAVGDIHSSEIPGASFLLDRYFGQS